MRRDLTAIVLQARMASSRLPGKALADIAGRSLLSHCLMRLLSSNAAPVVVATTTQEDDDLLTEEAVRQGAIVIRGPSADVLQRFVLVADQLGVRYMVRATADNPAVDIDAPARVLRALHKRGADYIVERGLPAGACVEAVRADALREAARLTQEPYDREHVTPYIRRHFDRYRAYEIDAPPAVWRPDLSFTVDTADDLVYVRQLFERIGAASRPVPLSEVINAAGEQHRPAEAA